MKILDCEGVALIIGGGDIGNCISDYLTTFSQRLEVYVCWRNSISPNNIYLYLENDELFNSSEIQISLFNKLLRLVINISGFLHSNHLT